MADLPSKNANLLDAVTGANPTDLVIVVDPTTGKMSRLTRDQFVTSFLASDAESVAGTVSTKPETPAGRSAATPETTVFATGNATTDTATLHAAVLDRYNKGGGVVSLSAGVWALSDELIVPESVSLWGAGGGWAKLAGTARPLTIIKCTTAAARVAVEGGSGTIGNFTIDGFNIATGPLLYRRTVAAKRLFMTIFLTQSTGEAWRIEEAQNDVHIDIHMNEIGGAGLTLDKGAGGLAFYGCEFARCGTWHLVIDETFGTGPYSAPSDNTFDHCLFELPKTGVTPIQGCLSIRTGQHNTFRSCSCNPVANVSVGVVQITGTGLGADPTVAFDTFWIANSVTGGTGIVQSAGDVYLSGLVTFEGLTNGWRYNAGNAYVMGRLVYGGVTNRWDAAGTGDFRTGVTTRFDRPGLFRVETNDFYALRVFSIGDTNTRLDITPDGKVLMGSGALATDVTLRRVAAGDLRVDNKLSVNGTLNPLGALDHDGTTVGFYGVTPVTRATAAAAATDAATTQTLANSLRTILINLGLAQ